MYTVGVQECYTVGVHCTGMYTVSVHEIYSECIGNVYSRCTGMYTVSVQECIQYVYRNVLQ